MKVRLGHLATVAMLLTLCPARGTAKNSGDLPHFFSLTLVGVFVGGGSTLVGLAAQSLLSDDSPGGAGRGRSDEEARAVMAEAVTDWLRRNAIELRLGLSSGHGPVIDDLAASVEVPVAHRRLFGKKLRSNRKELLELSSPSSLTPERATRFLRRVGEIMEGDPELRADLVLWRARTGAAKG